MKKDQKSRRKFFLKLFSNDQKSGMTSGSLLKDDDQNDKIRLLTPDGKLVEVDRRVVESGKQNTKVGNKELLKWMNEGKDKL